MFEDFRETMKQQFEMIDLGLMSYFLRIEVQQTNDGIFISQKKYALDILKHFKMEIIINNPYSYCRATRDEKGRH